MLTMPRRGATRRLSLAIATAALASAALASTASAAYVPHSYDWLTTKTARATVFSGSYVQWSVDRSGLIHTMRGTYKNVRVGDFASTPNQCIFAKIQWRRMGASPTIGYPPSLAVGTTLVDGGYLRSCRRRGETHPRPIVLSEAGFASRALRGTVLTVCHQRGPTHLPVCSSNRYDI